MKSLFLIRQLSTCLLCSFLMSGCVTHVGWEHPLEYNAHPQSQNSVHVPPGHLPPPGQCRIWFPDRPPGHQPPPGECHELRHKVPTSGVLVQG